MYYNDKISIIGIEYRHGTLTKASTGWKATSIIFCKRSILRKKIQVNLLTNQYSNVGVK